MRSSLVSINAAGIRLARGTRILAFLLAAGTAWATPAVDSRAADWFYNPFSADSAHHRPIGKGAKYAPADHPAVVVFQTATGLNINVGYTPWGCGVWEAKPDDPLFTVGFFKGDDGSRPGDFPVTCRLPLDMVMLQKRNRSGNFDGVLVVYDRAADTIHHFRQFNWNTESPTPDAKPTASAHKTWSIRGRGHNERLGEAVGTSASGVAAMFGILRGWEVKAAGHPISHALQMVLPSRPGDFAPMLGREVWWPAVSMDGFSYRNAETNVGPIAYGSLWAIPPVEKGGPDLAALGLSEAGLRLAECIRDYGIYAVDTGQSPSLRADQEFDETLRNELRAQSALFYKYIRLVENSVPEEGKIRFNVGDSRTNPTGGSNRQLVPGGFPAGGGQPLAPNTAIDGPASHETRIRP